MKMDRRLFLGLSIGTFVSSASARALDDEFVWRGLGLGARISIAFRAQNENGERAMLAARETVRHLESQFSLYDPHSSLSQLNSEGRLKMTPDFFGLVSVANQVFELTDGLFDPTVQPIFNAQLKQGKRLKRSDRLELAPLLGWQKVRYDDSEIVLVKEGAALTFNGIVQGYASDRVAQVLTSFGITDYRVNIGEYLVAGQARHFEIQDRGGRVRDEISVTNGAIATSSHNGFQFEDGSGHILSPRTGDEMLGIEKEPRFETISVVAETAAFADGFSTALMLSPHHDLRQKLIRDGHARKIVEIN